MHISRRAGRNGMNKTFQNTSQRAMAQPSLEWPYTGNCSIAQNSTSCLSAAYSMAHHLTCATHLLAGNGTGNLHSIGKPPDGWLHRHDQCGLEPSLPASPLPRWLYSACSGQLPHFVHFTGVVPRESEDTAFVLFPFQFLVWDSWQMPQAAA